MHKNKLNELYFLFKENSLSRNGLESSVYQYFIDNQDKTTLGRWEKDMYEDFLSWYYPRLCKTIDSYCEKEASFEVFMNVSLKLSAKEYYVNLTTKSFIEYSAWSVKVYDNYAREDAPHYLHEEQEKTLSSFIDKTKKIKNTKQLLILILKCYYYVTDDFIDRAATHIGIDKEKLREMINQLHKKRADKEERIFRMKENIYTQYYRCIVYEKRLACLDENAVTYLKLKNRLEKARKRLEKMRNRVSNMRKNPSNKEIAELLGLSKGTVDSSLFNLKAKWDAYAKKAKLN